MGFLAEKEMKLTHAARKGQVVYPVPGIGRTVPVDTAQGLSAFMHLGSRSR
jgi:hypothetical protein